MFSVYDLTMFGSVLVRVLRVLRTRTRALALVAVFASHVCIIEAICSTFCFCLSMVEVGLISSVRPHLITAVDAFGISAVSRLILLQSLSLCRVVNALAGARASAFSLFVSHSALAALG